MSDNDPTDGPEAAIRAKINKTLCGLVDAGYHVTAAHGVDQPTAFLCLLQVILSKSQIPREQAIDCLARLVEHNFGGRFALVELPPDERGDPTPPKPAVH